MNPFTITAALLAIAICGVTAAPQVPTDAGHPAPSGSAAPTDGEGNGTGISNPRPTDGEGNGTGVPNPSPTDSEGNGTGVPNPRPTDSNNNGTGYPEIVLPPTVVIGNCFPVEFLHNSSLVPFYVPAFNDTGFFLDFNANGTTIGSNVTTCSEFPIITSGLVPMPSPPAGGAGTVSPTQTGGATTVSPSQPGGAVPSSTVAPSQTIRGRQVIDPPSTANSTNGTTSAPGTATVPILVPLPTSISLNGTVNGTVPLPGLACFYFVRLNSTGCIPLCGAEPNSTWNGTNFIKQDDNKPKDGAEGVGAKAGSVLGLAVLALISVLM